MSTANVDVMSIFFILWSLALFAYGISTYWQFKPFRLWSGKRAYYLFAFCVCGLGFLLVGITGVGVWEPIGKIADVVFGVGFLLMAFAPCSMSIFNESPHLNAIKTSAFIGVGILNLLPVF